MSDFRFWILQHGAIPSEIRNPKSENPRFFMAARLRQFYQKTALPALTKEFGYKNVMAAPRLDKISINIGLGEATQNAKLMDGAVNELSQIAGQKPVVTKAKKSIAAFKAARKHAHRVAW